MDRSARFHCVVVVFALVVGVLRPAQADEPVPSDAIKAFWNEYEVDFTFQGLSTFYSCTGLRDNVKHILRQLGAREDLKVWARGCDPGGGPAVFPRVRIQAALPMAATPENLAELEKDADKRELVARVRGERYVDPSEEAAQFPATVETVRISSRESRQIEPGDCELLEQVRDRLLPKLGLTVTGEQLRCVPGQVRIGEVMLEVQTLKKVPTPDEASS